MKSFSLFFITISFLAGCGQKTDSADNVTEQQTSSSSTSSSQQGSQQSSNVNSPATREATFYMATWCPGSSQLKKFFNDERIKPVTAKLNLTFVFAKDEFSEPGEMADALKDSGRIGDQVRALKRRNASSGLFDPSFIEGLPGKIVRQKMPSLKSIPTARVNGEMITVSKWIVKTIENEGGIEKSVALAALKEAGQ